MAGKRRGRPRIIIGRTETRRRRDCLCCGAGFTSHGPHNRLCSRCRDDEGDYSSLGFIQRR
ncbi:hypothetical protein [Minwuia thermotolerans]|uniref:Uncharacterized protein n=1 Tax=Minwuia thermotolerans TaxID=2056226 RepID=A0A2M9G7C8_9PROT|nr:hypothetical protein [Minwuia thermotolerans]PJK31627.1 hypothetical protein CVT23_00820 [Minwuia thermotolerans]